VKTAHEPWTEGRAAGSEQRPELLGVHADDRQDVPQGALSYVAARVDRDHDRPTIGMAHHAMASADSHDREASPLKRPDPPSPPEWPERSRASGNVKSQRQLIRRADLGEQRFQDLPRVGNRGFRRRTVAYRPTPGRSYAEADQTPSSSCSTTSGTWTTRVTAPILPHQERGTDRRAGSYSASRILADAQPRRWSARLVQPDRLGEQDMQSSAASSSLTSARERAPIPTEVRSAGLRRFRQSLTLLIAHYLSRSAR